MPNRANRARDLLNKCLEENRARARAKNEKLESLLKNLEEEIEPFLKAVEKFAKTKEVDADALKIEDKDLITDSDQENAGPKKGSRRKKMPTVSENTVEIMKEVSVKKEKISAISEAASTKSSISPTTPSVTEVLKDNIKSEKDEMPAPSWIPSVDSGSSTDAESTRRTRTKTRSKKDEPNIKNEVEEVRSTRRETLRKGTKVDKEIKKDETEESQPEVRTTRTKTIRKGKEAETNANNVPNNNNDLEAGTKVDKEIKKDETEESQPEVRTTRTKTIRKGKEAETNANNVPNNNNDLEAEPTRSIRTKTRKQAKDAAPPSENEKPIEVAKTNREKPEQDAKVHSKRNRSEHCAEEELVGESKERKKSKSKSPPRDNRGNTTTRTVYEDARSTLGPPQHNQLSATLLTDKPKVTIPPLYSTMVIEPGAKYNIFDKKSIEFKTPPKKAHTTPKCTTPKKKVEKIPTIFAPSGFRFQPSGCSTAKMSRFISDQSNTTNGNDNLLGSTKSVQKDLRERQKKIMEIEPALKKNEAMLLAQAEAKIQLNKEKQLKAQQQRKVLEAERLELQKQKEERLKQREQEREEYLQKQKEERLKQREQEREEYLQKQKEERLKQREQEREEYLQKQKEERLKQREQEREEYLQKQKEERLKQREQEREEYLQKQKQELEKKRLAQKKKIQELQAAQRQQAEQSKSTPVYMVTEPPLLPTYDCYDSDDPEHKEAEPPSWCSSDQINNMQLAMVAAGEEIKNTLFCRRAQSPCLIDIFEVIDPRKLKRSSSILWKKPPQYTMMPDLNETRFTDDEELYESD